MSDPDIERPAPCAGRPQRPVDPDTGPIARLARELRESRHTAGTPTYRVPARRAHYAASTLAEAAKGDRLPMLAVTLAYVRPAAATSWAGRSAGRPPPRRPGRPRSRTNPRAPTRGWPPIASRTRRPSSAAPSRSRGRSRASKPRAGPGGSPCSRRPAAASPRSSAPGYRPAWTRSGSRADSPPAHTPWSNSPTRRPDCRTRTSTPTSTRTWSPRDWPRSPVRSAGRSTPGWRAGPTSDWYW